MARAGSVMPVRVPVRGLPNQTGGLRGGAGGENEFRPGCGCRRLHPGPTGTCLGRPDVRARWTGMAVAGLAWLVRLAMTSITAPSSMSVATATLIQRHSPKAMTPASAAICSPYSRATDAKASTLSPKLRESATAGADTGFLDGTFI